MESNVQVYTSTGFKLLRHPKLILAWQEGYPIPNSLQVALTEKCNLNCKFCSIRNRERKYEIDLDELVLATEKFISLGIKTIEITGGGEPLLYPNFNNYVDYLLRKNMKVGLITNGIGINKYAIGYLNWIRISANVYDYKNQIEIPLNFHGTLGFSYVWTEGISSISTLFKIKEIALKNKVSYVRVVPDCSRDDIAEQNRFLEEFVNQLGTPFFLQGKRFKTSNGCYWGYLKPFLYADGFVYPCSSVVLNPDADKKFHESYRICHWSDAEKVWRQEPIKSLIKTSKCPHCVFTKQNEMLNYIGNKQRHEDFI
ncbi:MAG: radical SAM protein [Candidatus Helarchaeota archaeon]|nr:radical SAM protein [Candidatus Helarchaeota archaeon]